MELLSVVRWTRASVVLWPAWDRGARPSSNSARAPIRLSVSLRSSRVVPHYARRRYIGCIEGESHATRMRRYARRSLRSIAGPLPVYSLGPDEHGSRPPSDAAGGSRRFLQCQEMVDGIATLDDVINRLAEVSRPSTHCLKPSRFARTATPRGSDERTAFRKTPRMALNVAARQLEIELQSLSGNWQAAEHTAYQRDHPAPDRNHTRERAATTFWPGCNPMWA